jgi:hypothetical protein
MGRMHIVSVLDDQSRVFISVLSISSLNEIR